MKIMLDARWIFREISGIGNYTRRLIRHLAEQGRDHAWILLFDDASLRDRTLREAGIENAAHVTTRLVPYGVFSLASQIRLPYLLRKERCDLYHSPNYMIPLAAFPRSQPGTTRCVITIHDVIPLLFPHAAPRSRKARLFPLYRWLMREVATRADLILTDSQASRRDILATLRIPPSGAEAVRSVYCGVADTFTPPDRLPTKPSIDRPGQLLYVGRLDPYKNVTGLIRAFAKARALCPFPIHLTLAGSPDPRYPEAGRLAAELGVADAVTWTGYLSDAALVQTYRDADLLVHPSRYEGFGLQVAEAMACGLPIVCSNAASLPEVVGEAGILLDPDDEAGFAIQIARLLNDPAERAQMRARGLERVRRFTWARTAADTLRLYMELLHAPYSPP